MFMIELWFVFALETGTQFCSAHTTFVSMLLGRDLCKADLKDLRTFLPCCPFYGNVMNDNCFFEITLFQQVVTGFRG